MLLSKLLPLLYSVCLPPSPHVPSSHPHVHAPIPSILHCCKPNLPSADESAQPAIRVFCKSGRGKLLYVAAKGYPLASLLLHLPPAPSVPMCVPPFPHCWQCLEHCGRDHQDLQSGCFTSQDKASCRRLLPKPSRFCFLLSILPLPAPLSPLRRPAA